MGKIGGWPASGFGERLRTQREAKGMSQKELGEKSGIHSNTIARLERGEQEPAWPLVLALAKALAVDCTAFSVEPEVESDKPEDKKPAAKKGKK